MFSLAIELSDARLLTAIESSGISSYLRFLCFSVSLVPHPHPRQSSQLEVKEEFVFIVSVLVRSEAARRRNGTEKVQDEAVSVASDTLTHTGSAQLQRYLLVREFKYKSRGLV